MYLYDLSKIAAMYIMHVYYILEGVGWDPAPADSLSLR